MNNEELVKQIQDGFSITDNMETLYKNNMPFIKTIVKPYTYFEPLEDLMQEAYFGLVEAVKRYDASENVKFLTYAGFWIKQAVQKYCDDCSSCVCIPSYFKGQISRYKKYVEYNTVYAKKPNMEQIRRDLGLSEKQIDEIRYYMYDIKSLDEPMGENTDGEAYSLSDMLSNNVDIAEDCVEREHKRQISTDLWYAVDNCLSDKEKNVIRLLYVNNETLEAIGQSMGITRERVRQLKAAGLRHLRIGKARQILRKYADTDRLLYSGSSVKNFENYGSNVENCAVRRVSIEEWIKEEFERRIKERECL